MQVMKYGCIERTIDAEYPSSIEQVCDYVYNNTAKGTYYGIASKEITINNKITVNPNCVFAIATNGILIKSGGLADITVIARLNYMGQDVYGVPVEEKGRLKYIDGCTDSLLIYPPKLSDPCINHLHFPAGIDQTFHTHPSVRMGLVLRGKGYACLGEGTERELNEGDIFCIDVDELHRFRTKGESMDIIAYHPDSDFGPTDEDHPMINRTVIRVK